ncbi:helix-turn-helix domain-containing protein [Risungbinella massiliensis]|uniref:helix-turn-helix domain-containing protein n=1 Tax=Risungbinella massiliensis TaxID=1329796 RepID=UPI000699BF3D|nr:helix-turn-helix transcriptional regulator [Risungbinella massiliensis]
MKKEKTIFSQRLRAARQRKKLTQKQLANHVGVVATTVVRWEQGKYEPDTDTITKIADLLGVTADYLIGMDGKKDPLAQLDLKKIRNDLVHKELTLNGITLEDQEQEEVRQLLTGILDRILRSSN